MRVTPWSLFALPVLLAADPTSKRATQGTAAIPAAPFRGTLTIGDRALPIQIRWSSSGDPSRGRQRAGRVPILPLSCFMARTELSLSRQCRDPLLEPRDRALRWDKPEESLRPMSRDRVIGSRYLPEYYNTSAAYCR